MSTGGAHLTEGGPEEGVTFFDGMRVEVFDLDRRPLFEASLEKINHRLAVLHRTSELFRAEFPALFEEGDEPAEVEARGFYAPRNIGVYLRGWLSPLPQGKTEQWMFQDVQVTGTDQGRAYYRTPLQAAGWTAPPPDAKDGFAKDGLAKDGPAKDGLAKDGLAKDGPAEDSLWTPCIITNASTGGARFRTAAALDVGDRIQLRFKLRKGKDQPPLMCEIRSGMERDGGYEYGCKFVDRTQDVDDIIVRTIIELQIMQS